MDFTKLKTRYLLDHQKFLDFVYDGAASKEISRRLNEVLDRAEKKEN